MHNFVIADLKCKFGEKLLNIGEGFQRNIGVFDSTKQVDCECILPPLLTCKGRYL